MFTVEVDRVPIYAVQGKWQSEVEPILGDQAIRDQLRLLKVNGKPLCDDYSIFRLRISRASEQALFFQKTGSLLTTGGQLAVLLVQPDDPSDAIATPYPT